MRGPMTILRGRRSRSLYGRVNSVKRSATRCAEVATTSSRPLACRWSAHSESFKTAYGQRPLRMRPPSRAARLPHAFERRRGSVPQGLRSAQCTSTCARCRFALTDFRTSLPCAHHRRLPARKASVAFFTLDVTTQTVYVQARDQRRTQPAEGAAQDRACGWSSAFAPMQADRDLEQRRDRDRELEEKPQADPGTIRACGCFAITSSTQAASLPTCSGTPRRRRSILWVRVEHAQVAKKHSAWAARHPKGLRATGFTGAATPARVTARLRLRPTAWMYSKLVDSRDLDPAVLTQMRRSPSVQARMDQADGFMNTIAASGTTDCDSYRCMLDQTPAVALGTTKTFADTVAIADAGLDCTAHRGACASVEACGKLRFVVRAWRTPPSRHQAVRAVGRRCAVRLRRNLPRLRKIRCALKLSAQ